MTINEIFIILHSLKKYFLNINNCLSNIRHEKIKKNNKNKTRFIKKFSRDVFSRLINIFKRFENRRVIFKNLTQIINIIKTRIKQKNCYQYEKKNISLKIILIKTSKIDLKKNQKKITTYRENSNAQLLYKYKQR